MVESSEVSSCSLCTTLSPLPLDPARAIEYFHWVLCQWFSHISPSGDVYCTFYTFSSGLETITFSTGHQWSCILCLSLNKWYFTYISCPIGKDVSVAFILFRALLASLASCRFWNAFQTLPLNLDNDLPPTQKVLYPLCLSVLPEICPLAASGPFQRIKGKVYSLVTSVPYDC